MVAEKVLVDTSAWINSFRKTGSPELKEYLRSVVLAGSAATSEIIILELLQGCRTEIERDDLRTKLESLDVLSVHTTIWTRSYEIGFTTKRAGFTIPTVDVIIAAVAIENHALVLHHDKHYEAIAAHSSLRTRHFMPANS